MEVVGGLCSCFPFVISHGILWILGLGVVSSWIITRVGILYGENIHEICLLIILVIWDTYQNIGWKH